MLHQDPHTFGITITKTVEEVVTFDEANDDMFLVDTFIKNRRMSELLLTSVIMKRLFQCTANFPSIT